MTLQACEIFLELNAYILKASDEEKFLFFLDLAAGGMSEEEFRKKRNIVEN